SLGKPYPEENICVGGLDLDPGEQFIFAVGREDSTLRSYDLVAQRWNYNLKLPAEPYTCLVHSQRPEAYVSLWGGSRVMVFSLADGRLLAEIPTGDHPNDMVLSLDGRRLFVANANLNTVSVVDLDARKVGETIATSLSPRALPGSTPNSVAISPNGQTLYVANADNNYVAVFDISRPGATGPKGFIPVGWYPTAVRVLQSGALLVLNGKGHGGSRANPGLPDISLPGPRDETFFANYIGNMFRGSLSFIPEPEQEQLQQWSRKVYANTPQAPPERKPAIQFRFSSHPIPRNIGDPSPIKYVFYIIKENRTYDQVFGDIPEGNGDSSLCLFSARITPNHHALAREFVLLDNLYANAEVSADGHEWSMAAYATDYVEKTWPGLYGGHGGQYPSEGLRAIAEPASGYIWDACRRTGISYRIYGEFVQYADWERKDTVVTRLESLQGHIAPLFPPYDLSIADTSRARLWMEEFDTYERNGQLPRLQIIRLPNDHTAGTRESMPTPRAMVADNDLALGMIIDRISHSRFWKESAIFVLEDDAQNGPDHVDAHRMVGLVVSPYTRRRHVDSNMYSTTSVLRTMQLILGLPPMSQFDSAALPMYDSFTHRADFTPYDHHPAVIDLDQMNPDGAYGQLRSAELNLAVEDAIPDVEFNEIVWKAIRGADSEMPAPVRSAFVRAFECTSAK
ncbi:MAG: alkaline phosphatase family protein, partial [Candidatus Neomarinimicrobiota bacterium]